MRVDVPGLARAAFRRLDQDPAMLLHFNPTNYLRLEDPRRLDTSASGASFATSTGDMLEVSSFGAGVFRMRIGPHTRPDYGILVGRVEAVHGSAAGSRHHWRSPQATPRSKSTGGPLRFRLLWRGAPVAGSITDQHFRGFTRLPTFGRIRQGGEWTAALALASGEPVYGLGEKFGPLDKRGQLIHSQVEDALGVNTGLSYKNTPFAWSPGTGTRRMGHVRAHARAWSTHGVGHPDWSHRSYAIVVDDEALDLFLFAADTPADILDLYTQLTGRAPDGAALEPRPVGVARVLQDAGGGDRGRGEAARAAHPLRRAHARRPRRVERPRRASTSNGIPSASPIRAQRSRELTRAPPARLRVGVSVRLDPQPLFRELFAQDLLLKNDDGDPYVFSWDTTPATSPVRQRADAAAGERHRRLHESRRVRVVARCAPASSSTTAST